MSMLDQIGREKRRITEQLARLDAERAKLSDQLNELEIAQRAVRRFGDKAVATKKRRRAPAPKTAPMVGAERSAQGGQQAQGISLGDATLRAVRAHPNGASSDAPLKHLSRKFGQPAYTAPDPITGDGTEAYFRYDSYEPGQLMADPDFPEDARFALGQLVSVADRGSHLRFNYDNRARLRRAVRAVAVPGNASAALSERYSDHWFSVRANYDFHDRLTQRSTGVDVSQLLGGDQSSKVSYEYSDRGLPRAISSSYSPLIRSAGFDAEGLPLNVIFGDVASTQGTSTYDDRGRLSTYLINRVAPVVWQMATPTYTLPSRDTTQLDISKLQFAYDDVGNPTEIQNLASAAQWPSGATPVIRFIEYDDLYRVNLTTYSYPGSNDQVPPFAHELKAGSTAPVPLRQPAARIGSQEFHYDWKGNVQTADDSNLLYDRSIGDAAYGEAQGKPNQLLSAGNGGIEVEYDEAGNMVDFRLERSGTCPSGTRENVCAQRFVFDWDEVGRLARGRRWDYVGNSIPADEPKYPNVPSRSATWDVTYAYSQGGRVLKSVQAEDGVLRHQLEVFDSLRLNMARVRRGEA